MQGVLADMEAMKPAVRDAVERARQERDTGGEYCNVCENYPCLGNHPSA